MADNKPKWTDADKVDLMERVSNGEKPMEIAKATGRTRASVYGKIEVLEGRANRNYTGRIKVSLGCVEGKAKSEMAAKLAKEIPADTRTLSQVICGDPLAGRSAWDMRKAQVEA